MKKFLVTFKDTITAETEEDAYDELIKYLRGVVGYEDMGNPQRLSPFDFKEIKEPRGSYHM